MCSLPEDAQGLHIGAVVNDKIVGVISLFKVSSSRSQFRKLAVD